MCTVNDLPNPNSIILTLQPYKALAVCTASRVYIHLPGTHRALFWYGAQNVLGPIKRNINKIISLKMSLYDHVSTNQFYNSLVHFGETGELNYLN